MIVRWTRSAARDLTEAMAWISERNPQAAVEVATRIRAASERLGTHPEIGRTGSVEGTREKLCLPYPYLIVYEIRAVDEVWILRLFHMAQERS